MSETVPQKTTIDMVNGLSEIADYMQDEELTTALTMIAKIIIKPDVPIQVASLEIVRLQAIAAKMSFKATWMANVDKSDRAKKNIYFTAAQAINDLVSALKYAENIEPFKLDCLGTNSYDVHLGKYLATYKDRVLDAKAHNKIEHLPNDLPVLAN